MNPRWRLTVEPRAWQIAATEKWENAGHRGVASVVTGGGKTVFAFHLMSRVDVKDTLRYLILVPTLALLDQWVISLQDELGVSPNEIGTLGGGENSVGKRPIVVAVVNSARNAPSLPRSPSTMLIVDECHRVASPANAKALSGEFGYRLGLSATPEREHDDGFDRYIVPALGPIVFNYDYSDAARDGVISPFELVNIELPMSGTEASTYADLSRRIAILRRKASHDSDADAALKMLLIRRAGVVNTLRLRVPAAVRLIERHKTERSIVFHERVQDATEIYNLLKKRGYNVVLYHAGIEPSLRRESLRQFRRGVYDVLVCCRALDEGMNVPETTVAVVASATASQRQRIQRLGRILRSAATKRPSSSR